MLVNPFWLGVGVTLLSELLVLFIVAIIVGGRH